MSITTHVIRGTAHWAKVLGPPRDNEYTGEREWSIDLTPDEDGRKLLKELGLSDRLREPKGKDTREQSFLSFRHREYKADGEKADPIRVVNASAEPWTKEMGLIGNGSDVNIKFAKKDYGKGKKAGMYIRAIQVINLVPYVTQDFAPVESDDQFFGGENNDEPVQGQLPEGMEPVVDPLDDDIPE